MPINNMKSRRNWTEKEDQTFRRIVTQCKSLNWAQIAKKLSYDFGFKKRTGKQCRQRWFNHLVPGISKRLWNKTQEENLLNLHKRFGNKWTIISQHLPGRTDNSIKNYFYSTIRRSLRRMGKIIGSKNSTSLLREIKPSILTKIFSSKSEEQLDNFQSFRSQCQKCQIYNINDIFQKIRDEIIQFSTFKPKINYQITSLQRQRYQEVFDLIVRLNRIYEGMKQKERNRKSKEQIFKKDFKMMMNQESQDQKQDEELESFDVEEQEKVDQEQHIDMKLKETTIIRKQQEAQPQEILEQSCRKDSKPLQQTLQVVDYHRAMHRISEKQMKELDLILLQHQPSINRIRQVEEQYNQDPVFQIEIPEDDSYQYTKCLNFNINLSPSINKLQQINFFKSPMAIKGILINNLYQQLMMDHERQEGMFKALSKHPSQVQQQN